MTKIMFFLTAYEIGGPSRVVRNLLDCMDRDKYDILLLTEKLLDKHYPVDKSIKLINLDIFPQKGFFAKVFNVINHLASVRRHIIAEAPDVIISFTTSANCYALLASLFRMRKRIKIIITEHSEEMFLPIKNKNIKYFIFKSVYWILMVILYRRADYIVAASKSIARNIKRLWFLPSCKVNTIYIPVNINKIKELANTDDSSIGSNNSLPCVGTVSRLSPEKGVHFLIQGFKGLLGKIDARLIVVGDGMERPRLEKMADDLGIKEKVIFTGWKENVFKYLAKMDIFVLPSLWEGFPNVILEAMACSVPVIASDSVGGIREVIQNERNGLLIKPESPAAISESVYYLLSNKEKRENIIEEACKGVKKFDLSVIKKQYESLIFS